MATILSTARITALRAESGEAGDTEMVAVCDRALRGESDALAECARVVEAAAGIAITFDRGGESRETLVHSTERPVFVRRDDDQYVVGDLATGEPTEGNQYLRSASLADLLDTLRRRGYVITTAE